MELIRLREGAVLDPRCRSGEAPEAIVQVSAIAAPSMIRVTDCDDIRRFVYSVLRRIICPPLCARQGMYPSFNLVRLLIVPQIYLHSVILTTDFFDNCQNNKERGVAFTAYFLNIINNRIYTYISEFPFLMYMTANI